MTQKNQALPKLIPQEWPHFFAVDDLGTQAIRLEIAPTAEQARALCKRLDLLALEGLVAKLAITRNKGNMVIHVTGSLEAQVTQRCVVTLTPVKAKIHEELEGWFADPHQAVSFAKAKRERLSPQELMDQPILEEAEDPEPVIDGKIDLGEFVTQFLSLALEPYPRAQGVEYAQTLQGPEHEPDGVYDNPFAALKEWKARDQKKDK